MEATADVEEVRLAQVFAWRMQTFLNLGFTAPDAEELAADEGVDLHTAEQLMASGCSTGLALRILL